MSHSGELLSAFLDGELSAAEVAELMTHLDACGSCAAELEDLQRVRTAVRSLPLFELPWGIVPEADRVVVPLRRHRGFWVGAAAALVAIVVAVAALLTPAPAVVSVDDLNSRFAARVSLDPAFGPAKVVVPGVAGRE